MMSSVVLIVEAGRGCGEDRVLLARCASVVFNFAAALEGLILTHIKNSLARRVNQQHKGHHSTVMETSKWLRKAISTSLQIGPRSVSTKWTQRWPRLRARLPRCRPM